MNKKKLNPIFIVLIFSIFMMIFIGPYINSLAIDTLSYNDFVGKVQNDEINEITVQDQSGVYVIKGSFSDEEKTKQFYTEVIATDQMKNEVSAIASSNDVKVNILNNQSRSTTEALSSLIGFLLFAGVTVWVVRTIVSQGKKNGQFGNSKARRIENPTTKFSDVAGYEEEKQELAEIVDFLKDPTIYNKMGARIPKGILLEGPPGTGKTLLARSIAGESNVPFFTVSGSEFVEMYVGVGASRVRDLFKQAKKNSPAIIFIDEIDALGKKRGNGQGNANDEKEQTLNQLLVEMDGFAANSGIIIIAATNRREMLDDALLRPGRFDRQVMVDLPDMKTREEILKLHAKNKEISTKVDIPAYAKKTSGFSGAQIENVLNEAAIVAVRDRKKQISDADINEAIDRVISGPAKKTRKYTERDKNIVSYHETGHVIIGLELDNADTVEKVTIVPRGKAGGYMMSTPKEETFFQTKRELLDQITRLVAGRASEELFVGDVSTGAHNDFERATKMARAMVTMYGMTDLGLTQFELIEDLQNPYKGPKYSESMSERIDAKIDEILRKCYEHAKAILTKRKDDVHLIANALKERESLTFDDISYLIDNRELKEIEEQEYLDDKEILSIKREEYKKQFKKLQARQIELKKDNPDVKVITDEEIDEKIKNQIEKVEKNSLQNKMKNKN